MARLRLPWGAGRREQVGELFAEQQVPPALDGEVFVALCRDLVTASESFVDELVRQVLVERRAVELAIVGTDGEFVDACAAAAERYGVAGRVRQRRAVEVGV